MLFISYYILIPKRRWIIAWSIGKYINFSENVFSCTTSRVNRSALQEMLILNGNLILYTSVLVHAFCLCIRILLLRAMWCCVCDTHSNGTSRPSVDETNELLNAQIVWISLRLAWSAVKRHRGLFWKLDWKLSVGWTRNIIIDYAYILYYIYRWTNRLHFNVSRFRPSPAERTKTHRQQILNDTTDPGDVHHQQRREQTICARARSPFQHDARPESWPNNVGSVQNRIDRSRVECVYRAIAPNQCGR